MIVATIPLRIRIGILKQSFDCKNSKILSSHNNNKTTAIIIMIWMQISKIMVKYLAESIVKSIAINYEYFSLKYCQDSSYKY